MHITSNGLTIPVPMTDVGRIPTGCGRNPSTIVEAAIRAVPEVVRVTTTIGNSVDMTGNPQMLVVVFRRQGSDWASVYPQVADAISQCWKTAPQLAT